MPEQITLSRLKNDLVFFNKMYDAVRLVDPVGKRVLEYYDHGAEKTRFVTTIGKTGIYAIIASQFVPIMKTRAI